MLSRRHTRLSVFALVVTFALACASHAIAQDRDEFGDEAADPVKLFNQGQDAHAKKNYEQAIEFYEEALKLKPEFPEAEFQKANALVALKRFDEAEKSYRRAMELKPAWSLPPAALGLLLASGKGRETEAETLLRRALTLEQKNITALIALGELRRHAGNAREAAALYAQATTFKDSDAALWLARAAVEREAKLPADALKSLDRAVALEPSNVEARLARADALIESGDKARAVEDLRALEEASKADWKIAVALANRYGLAGQTEEARRIFNSLPDEAKNSDDGKRLYAALTDLRCEDTPEGRAALEKIIASNAKNAPALACLGGLLRTTDPSRSLELFRRASEIEPRNVDYAIGYAAALVQLKNFEQAAAILQRILQFAPERYEAHANLAAALYELKLYKRAIVEYKWIEQARPDLAIVHFFIGIAHDQLGEYTDALASYETFLSRADAQANQLEIEKVNLRLPSLRNQIKRGEGVKPEKKGQ
jgi:tetratricopeptide (TPR) repeat protein